MELETCYKNLSDYEKNGWKILDSWDDRQSPTKGGYNYATVEHSSGTRFNIGYMYEDLIWMPL